MDDSNVGEGEHAARQKAAGEPAAAAAAACSRGSVGKQPGEAGSLNQLGYNLSKPSLL